MDILHELVDALRSEKRVMLATIISTNGSTPAAALSKMLVRDGGKSWIGTVGGGCVEGDVLQAAIERYGSGEATILTFHLNEDNLDQGLICGGSMDVLVEPVVKKDAPIFEEMAKIRDDGSDCVLATFVSRSGTVAAKWVMIPLSSHGGGTPDWRISGENASPLADLELSRDDIDDAARKALHAGDTQRITTKKGEFIFEPVGGMPRLVIFGGGHVSKYVSRAAAMSGFRVTIVDDRPEYANAARFPEAEQTIALNFNDAIAQIDIGRSTYLVIVTRGHRSDEEILERVVASPAKYIGMIGSKRKVLTTYEHLAARGVSQELMNRVHAPIGIEIGAATAEEIGISVVAQLIAVRRGAAEGLPHKKVAPCFPR